jgi:hypothetical protein
MKRLPATPHSILRKNAGRFYRFGTALNGSLGADTFTSKLVCGGTAEKTKTTLRLKDIQV